MLLVLIAAGGAVLWIYRIELLTTTAARILEQNGFGPAHLVIDQAGVNGLHARDISLYGGAVQIPELTVAYSPFGLLARHLKQVRIAGLRATLSAEGDTITIGGKPLPLSGSASGGGVRIDALTLDDARIVVDRPGGKLEASFSTELALAGADLSKASFALDIAVPIGGAPQPVRVVVREFALTSQEGSGLRLTFANADVIPQALPWSAEGIAGELIWSDGATAKVTIDSLKNRQQPPVIQPLRLTAEAALVGTNLDFTLHAETGAAGGKGKLTMDIKGRHDRKADSGSATLAMSPAAFRAQGLQPVDFFPALEDALSNVSGTVAVSGSARWRGLDVAPDIRIRLSDVAVDAPAARLSNVNGAINLVSFWPPGTPPNQVLKGTVEPGGLPPSDMTLQFHLEPAPALAVETLTFAFSGGRISAAPFVIDPAAPELATALTIEQLDLDKLFTLIDVDGLGGTGRLDGQMRLRLVESRVRINDGRLAASGPGVLHFKSAALPKEISAAGQPVQLALEALTDFHYDSLSMEIDQDPSGAGVILLKLLGHNPAVLDGRPFQFNIKFESNFDRLTDLALRSLTAAQDLLRRAVGTKR